MQLTQFALKKLDLIVDEFWAEISDSIQTIEVLKDIFSILVYTSHQVVSEDDLYPAEVRQQAALVASKVGDSSILVCLTCMWVFIVQVYYHLGSYEDSLQYALGAATLFDISDTRSQ